jgi:hypothetical protein
MSRSYQWRLSIMRCVAVVILAVTTFALTSLSTASAEQQANPTTRCHHPGGVTFRCELQIPDFPGGTMSIDVDADGHGTGHWILFWNGSWRACETDYDLVAPAQSWVCNNLPSGNYVLFNAGQLDTTFHELGVRY